jgi:hypothetical protein
MQRIEHDHAGSDWHLVVDQFASFNVAAKNFESCVCHNVSQLSLVRRQLLSSRLGSSLDAAFLQLTTDD